MLYEVITRALVVGKTDSILLEDLPFHIYSSNAMLDDGEKSLSAMEKKHIIRVSYNFV